MEEAVPPAKTGHKSNRTKYNFNNDKSTENVFGLKDGDESWEFLNNTSNRVLFKSADFTSTATNSSGQVVPAWQIDFEARYPDGNTDPSKLKQIVEWVVSTKDDIQKFKDEFEDYFVLSDSTFYYLYTHFFALVDSRAKNCFITYISDLDRWMWLPYDFDTALGINNEGAYVYDYYLEDTDDLGGEAVFNGKDSVLWNNFRIAFKDEIAEMYKDLRSGRQFTYEYIDDLFETHQSIWPEAIWNEDAKRKYITPLLVEGNAMYLAMLQGTKKTRRRRWLMNRFRYFDSKYHTGYDVNTSKNEYMDNEVAILRAYNKADITVTTVIDMYCNIQYGSQLEPVRVVRNTPTPIPCKVDTLSDTEVHIYSASLISDLGDLSPLNVGLLNLSPCVKLERLKVGDGAANYQNTKLETVSLENNPMLKFVDFRNCVALGSSGAPIDLSGCEALEEVYFEGSGITGVTLPPAGNLKVLHLPATVTNLTIRNHPDLTDFQIESTENITTLRIENTPAVDVFTILQGMPANSRVRLIGFNVEMESVDKVYEFVGMFDSFRGLDENGNNTSAAQISGTIHVDTIHMNDILTLRAKYPYLTFTYNNIYTDLTFMDDEGSTTYYVDTLLNGSDSTYAVVPAKEATQQYYFTFAGWSLTPGGDVAQNALESVTTNRIVYAVFTPHLQTYYASYYLGTRLLEKTPWLYGTKPSYSGDVSELEDPDKSGTPFQRWLPDDSIITCDTDYFASFIPDIIQEEINDSLTNILANIHAGLHTDFYNLGNYITVPFGDETIRLQIAAFDRDTKLDGTKGKVSFVVKDILKDNSQWSTVAGEQIFEYVEGPSWKTSAQDSNAFFTTIEYCVGSVAHASWQITASAATTLTITYGTRSADSTISQLSLTVDGVTLCTDQAVQPLLTYSVGLTAGQTITVDSTWKNYTTDYQFAQVAFSGSGITITPTIDDATIRVSAGYINGTVNGWKDSYIRTKLQGMKLLLPEEIQNAMVPVEKTQIIFDDKGMRTTQTTIDEIFLLSDTEITETMARGGIYTHLFNNNGDRIKKKMDETTASPYWTRTARTTKAATTVVSNGALSYSDATNSVGVVFGIVVD